MAWEAEMELGKRNGRAWQREGRGESRGGWRQKGKGEIS
jgi:hypothetical protein